MRSTSCGNVPAERRASIGPTGKPWQTITAGRGSDGPDGTVKWHASVFEPDRNVPFTARAAARWSRPRWTDRAAPARGGQCVTAVARLGEGVGREPDPDAQLHELLDDGRVVPVVEVVDQLRPLVSDVAEVLEA